MKRAIIVRGGVVDEVLSAHFVKNNTDWLQNGVPDIARLIEDDDDFRVGDHLTAEGKPDTLRRDKAAKLAEIAAARWEAQNGGCDVGGMRILTDKDSQVALMGAYMAAADNPEYKCQWKTPGGFITLNASTIVAAANAVRAFVQGCFDKEAELIKRVEAAETAEEVAAVAWAD